MTQDIRFRVALDGVQQVQQGATQTAASLERIGHAGANAATQTSGAFASIGGAVKAVAGLAIANELAQAARAAVQTADAVTSLNNSLTLATGSAKAAGVVYDELYGIAQRSRTGFLELGGTYASIARATDGLGVSQTRLLKITEAIGNAMAISGGSAAGMQAALTQLGQGLASGALRGDELNSVLEQTPRLARAIADGLGVTVGKLREMGKEGQLTAEAVLQALESQAAKLATEVQGSVVTVSQALTQVSNAATKAIGEIDRSAGVTSSLSGALQTLASSVDDVSDRFQRARESGLGFFGALAAAQVMGVAEALGHVDERAANIGRRLGEAEKELAALQLRFAANGGQYLAFEVEKARELVEQLKQAKQAQDELRAQRGTSQSQQFGEASAGIDAVAKKGLEEQAAAAKLLADIRNKALGVDTAYLKQVNELNAARQKGHITEKQYVETVQQLTAATFKKTAATKKDKEEMDDAVKVFEDLTKAGRDWARGLEGTNAGMEKELALGRQLTEGERQHLELTTKLAAGQLVMSEATERAARASIDRGQALREEVSWMRQASAENDASMARLAGQTADLEGRAVALRKVNDQALLTPAALRQIEQAEHLANAAAKERLATVFESVDPAIAGEYRKQAAALREIAAQSGRAAGIEATKEARDAWQRMADDAGQALTDALMSGGRDAGELLEDYFKTLVLRPIIQAVVSPVTGAIAAFLTGGAGGAGGGGAGAVGAGLNNASTLYSLYQGATGYSSSVNALAGYFGAGTTAGASSTSLAYANLVGSAGGDSMGALIAANNGWAGVGASASSLAASESATLFASQAAGEGITVAGTSAAGAGGSSSAAAGMGPWAAYAAAIIAAYMGSRSAWEKGYNNENLSGAFRYSPESTFTDLLKIGGMSDRSANIWGGGAVYTQLFGRASPRVVDQGVAGTITGGDFAGEMFADILEKGGIFRSDKRRTETKAATESIDMFFDDASKEVLAQAKRYAEALGLPAEEMARITTEIRVSLGDDVEKNKTAIIQALAKYGEALTAGLADEVAPLAKYGETVTQTIERVGGAILGVNAVLEDLGITALQASLDGGSAAIDLTAMFGGIQGLSQAAGQYFSNFYTEAEQIELASGKVSDALASVGLAMPDTVDAYKDLVSAQDLSTEAGREAFTALLQVSGAFHQVESASEAAAKKLTEEAAARAKQGQQALDQLAGKFLEGPDLDRYRYNRVAGDLTQAGLAVTGERLAGMSKEQIEAFVRQFVDFADGVSEMELAVLSAAGSLGDLKNGARDAADALQSTIESNRSKLLPADQRIGAAYQGIADDLADAGFDITVSQLFKASKQEILETADAITAMADVSDEAKAAIWQAAGALGDLKSEASEFGGMRIRSMGQASAADQAYREWMGIESKIAGFAQDWANNTLPANLQQYVDQHWGGKDNVPGPTRDGIFNMYVMQSNGPANTDVVSPDRLRREQAEAAAASGGSTAISESDRQAQELARDELRALDELNSTLQRLDASFTSFMDSLTTGSLSALSPEDRLAEARSQFFDNAEAARGGDLAAFERADDLASTFLQLQQQLSGAPNYAPVFDEVLAELKRLQAELAAIKGNTKTAAEVMAASGVALSDALDTSNRMTAQQLAYDAARRGRYVASL